MDTTTLPPQPSEDAWGFIDELKSPLWTRHDWPGRPAEEAEVNLSAGVRVARGFPDPAARLDTAYDDLQRFLAAGDVATGAGPFTIRTVLDDQLGEEAYRIESDHESCRILAGDPEGIRRGVFHLEDLMLAAQGPFLPVGTIERTPFIRRRVSRCFFGPIKRPPKMRDELMDDVDYYPDQYLNRLAHDGVNGLWLTVEFRDLVRTRFTPECGADAEKRLGKLRRTVDQCLRYGIRTYIFCIEPRAWEADDPAIRRHPEMAGSASYGHRITFCPRSEASREYLETSTRSIFSSVPGLGGIINITHGERPTTCLSTASAVGDGAVTCPRCSRGEPWEILHASLSAMERGMHSAEPDAELISWLYMPQPQGPGGHELAPWVYDIPAHTPDGVILQFNFESGVRREFFGRDLVGGDYWISTPGPSDRFERVAETARAAGTPVSAKIQTGCSHEVASIPFVPVPSLLQRKFAAMRTLGVSHTMLCWYFGNYPGLMNRAAGRLSFESFPEDEDTFLLELAERDWGRLAPHAVEAWRLFAEGYANYPLTNLFQYYGPMHDGPVWPLLLRPEDAMLSPTWLLGSTTTREPWPPSGDRVGECIHGAYTLDEAVELTRRIDDCWSRGVAILAGLRDQVRNRPERLRDIDLAEALGIQFRSGHSILRFYHLRERMVRMSSDERLALLADIRTIVEDELRNGPRLIELCEDDARLGFHSEAEGYKYFPAKIRWRMEQLRGVLEHDMPEVEAAIRRGDLLFPEYTGRTPAGPIARSPRREDAASTFATLAMPPDLDWHDRPTRWAFARDDEFLYLFVESSAGASVTLKLEPRRLWPVTRYALSPSDAENVRATRSDDGWRAALRIPLADFDRDERGLTPVRVDVQQSSADSGLRAWMPQHPQTPRLRLGADNPRDLGWLLFEE